MVYRVSGKLRPVLSCLWVWLDMGVLWIMDESWWEKNWGGMFFARYLPVCGRSCVRGPHILHCWCLSWGELVLIGCSLGQGWAGLIGMTGKAEIFARDSPVLGRICLGGPCVLCCWRLA